MYKRIVLLILGLLSVFGLFGCGQDNSTFYDWEEERQQEYVRKYIKQQYGLEGDLYEIDYLIGYGYDNLMTTLFTLPDGRYFRLWIHEDGSITDLKFKWELQDDLDKLIHDKLEAIAGENAVYNDFGILSFPKKVWTEDDDLWQMLVEEHMWHAVYAVFPCELTVEELERIEEDFAGIDVTICIYYRNHPLEESDFEELMITECEETIEIEKDGK